MFEVFNTYQLGIDYNNQYVSIEQGKLKKMNNFCQVLADSLREEFEIEVDFFVSKKKTIVQMSLMKPLVWYKLFNKIIKFIKNY